VKHEYDILIVGGGLIGQITALACARLRKFSVALVDGRNILDRPSLGRDGRAFALTAGSMNLLKNLEVDMKVASEPIRDMLITDGAIGKDSQWRLHFGAEDKGPMAQMVESALLSDLVLHQIEQTPNITIFAPKIIEGLTHTPSGVLGRLGKDTIEAQLLIAADGANSPIRQAAGIVTDGRDYEQKALVTTVSHSLPHDGLAMQRFLPGGPLAVLPLTRQRSQIVWSDKAAAIDAACALDEAEFMAELSLRIGSYLGKLHSPAPRGSYPLHLQLAQNYVGTRLVLIGDAAHVIHPLAGQGLNLGLRDVGALFDVLQEALSVGRDIGGEVLGDYAAWRKSDVTALAAVTDGLSYLYAAPKGPLSRPIAKTLGHFRRVGLSAVNSSESLKALFMQEASGDTGDSPRLLNAVFE
jgi:2-octaprenyl-6-methoxyphenol hydroxylase